VTTAKVAARAALGLELLAPAIAGGVAVALANDDRATTLHSISTWTAVAVAAAPVFLQLVRVRITFAIDAWAACALLVPMLGSFTIGGLALGIPALLLGVAAVLRSLETVVGSGLQRAAATGIIVLGSLMLLGGAVSMGPSMVVAPVGILLVVVGALLRRSVRTAGS